MIICNDETKPTCDTGNGYIFATREQAYRDSARTSFHYMSCVGYVQFTAPTIFNYTWPCKVEGWIDDDTNNNLFTLLQCYHRKDGTIPVVPEFIPQW